MCDSCRVQTALLKIAELEKRVAFLEGEHCAALQVISVMDKNITELVNITEAIAHKLNGHGTALQGIVFNEN